MHQTCLGLNSAICFAKKVEIAASRQADDLEMVRKRSDDVQRLTTDGARGAEHYDAFHKSIARTGSRREPRDIEGCGDGKGQAIQAVQDTAVSGNYTTSVLYLGDTF